MSEPREAPERIVPGRNRTGADIPKFRIVQLDDANGDEAVKLATGAAVQPYGVTLGAIIDQTNGDVAQGGICRVEAGAAIGTRGTRLTSDANGKAVAATSDNDFIIGTNLTTAGADGDVIEASIIAPAVQRGV